MLARIWRSLILSSVSISTLLTCYGASAACLVVSGIDYDYNDALLWASRYLGEKHNVEYRRQHWMTLPKGTRIMAWQTAQATVAGKTCTIFASWQDLAKFLNDPPAEFWPELVAPALLIYQGTHGVPGGEAHCNDGEYILGRHILDAMRAIHNNEYYQHHQIAVLVDSCYSGDLLRKLILAHTREKTDLQRLCLVTSSAFGHVSYQGEEFYRLVADLTPGEDISLLQRFKDWSIKKNKRAMISASPFDSLGLTAPVLEDFALPATATFLEHMAQILEQDARESDELKYLAAFYHLTPAQDKQDIYEIDQGRYFSLADQDTFYFQQFQIRFYIEDLIKRLQEDQRSWRLWKKKIHDPAHEWVMSAAQEFLAVLVSGLRSDQQWRGELINYYRLQELFTEAWQSSFPVTDVPPVDFKHPTDPATALDHLIANLPWAPPTKALREDLRMQARLERWDRQSPFRGYRVWKKNATAASLTQMAQIILQGRLRHVPLAEDAANTLARVGRYLLDHLPTEISEADYIRWQACQNFNFKDL